MRRGKRGEFLKGNKMTKDNIPALPDDTIISKIYLVRDKKIILDRDLAELYVVKTKALKQAVKRNIERVPDDFMFEMTAEDFTI